MSIEEDMQRFLETRDFYFEIFRAGYLAARRGRTIPKDDEIVNEFLPWFEEITRMRIYGTLS